MTPQVVPIQADGRNRAAAVLARAFLDDPLFSAMFPDDRRRARIMSAYARWSIEANRPGGGVVETTASRSAFSIWLPPGHRHPWWVALKTAPRLLRLSVLARGYGRPALAWARNEEGRRRELVPEPHWWLVMLGVDPRRQGLGLGAVLVLHGLARVDAERKPVYVQTDTEANARFYGKLGFEVLEHAGASDEPLPVPAWRMVRRRR